MSMGRQSNAERQKRWRDRNRGGAPVGRWPEGYVSVARQAKVFQVGRTLMFMSRWILKHAPEFEAPILSGEIKRVTPLYRKLKRDYDLGIFRALQGATSDQAAGNGWSLTEGRQDGHFTFRWVRVP
jgi:hypothetical protein